MNKLQEDGTKLVGQCEISHPVRSTASGLSITVDGQDNLVSPIDDLGESVGRPNNVLFESAKKDEYEPLESRIAREFLLSGCPIYFLTYSRTKACSTSTLMATRSILLRTLTISII